MQGCVRLRDALKFIWEAIVTITVMESRFFDKCGSGFPEQKVSKRSQNASILHLTWATTGQRYIITLRPRAEPVQLGQAVSGSMVVCRLNPRQQQHKLSKHIYSA